MDSQFCEDCNAIANSRIAKWKKGDRSEKLLFHPIMGEPIHYVADLAFRLGIGGTLCRKRQGYIVE